MLHFLRSQYCYAIYLVHATVVVPPPEVSVVNDTPVVDAENGTVSVDFTIDSSRTVDAFCQLLRRNPGDNFATVLVNSSCFSGILYIQWNSSNLEP